MTPHTDYGNLEELRVEVESFIISSHALMVLEEDAKILDLADSEWRLAIEFGKLMFEVWRPGRSFAWRVEAIAYRNGVRLGLSVRRPGARGTSSLELRELAENPAAAKQDARSALRQRLLAFLEAHYPGCRFEGMSSRTDREFSFSAWYTRGLARCSRAAWAFLALSEAESPAAVDAVLGQGLNWLAWLRERRDQCVISGLKLFLPPSAVSLTAQRASCLDPAAAQLEIFEWPASKPDGFYPVDLKDFGNIETRLAPRRSADGWRERHHSFLQSAFGNALDHIEPVPEASGAGVSLRILGLEIGRLEGLISPQFYWGLEGRRRRYALDRSEEWRSFLGETVTLRSPSSPDRAHELYRLQPERWLESLLVRDLTKLDPALNAEHVYPQVPAFTGADRGVVDILSIQRNGRLAVIELKLHEEMMLPFQGLDYWVRVKWLNDRNQFQQSGYFRGVELSQAPPALYLVSPAFRFHSTTQRLIRYLQPSIEVIQVGINQQWRKGVKVLFRRRIHPP